MILHGLIYYCLVIIGGKHLHKHLHTKMRYLRSTWGAIFCQGTILEVKLLVLYSHQCLFPPE